MSFSDDGGLAALVSRPARQSNPRTQINRPRVTALIDAGAAAALCIVHGPRDCGKSVALSQWAATTERDVRWLNLTEDSAQPQQFWQQLHAALQSKFQAFFTEPDPAGPPLSAGATESSSPAHWLAAQLSGSAPFTLVVEDFHHVQASSVQQGLLEMLEQAPHMSMMVATRSTLEVERGYAASTTDFEVIGSEELKFTSAEARAFHAGTVLETVSGELNERLYGSPVLHRSARNVALGPRGRSTNLVDYIVHQVTATLHQQLASGQQLAKDRGWGRFVAATLPLLHFDVALARAVSPGCDQVESLIRNLIESGTLHATTINGTLRYSYPPIVVGMLGPLLADELAETRDHTLATAAAFEFARGEYLPAFSYAVANNDYRFSASMLLESGLKLLSDHESEFAVALKTIPHTQIAKYPLLSLALALVYNADKRTRLKGAEYFALALASSVSLGRVLPPEERLAMRMAQAVALRLTGQFKQAAAASRASLRNRSELPLEDRDRIAAFESFALAQWGHSLVFTGDFPSATTALHWAISTAPATGSDQALFFATSLLAYRYALDDDLATAAEFAESALKILPTVLALGRSQQTPLFMTLAMIELGRLQPSAASEHLDKVIFEASTSEFWGRLRIIEAQIDLLRGQSGIATGRLDAALANKRELPALNPVDASALTAVRSALLLSRGNASGAAALLSKPSAKGAPAKIARARLSLSLGRPAEVVEILSSMSNQTTSLHALDALVLMTVARLHLQDAATVHADIEQISGAVTALRNQWPLAMLPEPALKLLKSAWQELGVPAPEAPAPSEALIPAALSRISLTPREASILATLATTSDRSEIARIHFVSPNTIKSQLRTLYKKLGVGSRKDALLVANQEHLLKD